MKKDKSLQNFGVASSVWCKMSDIKIDEPHIESLNDAASEVDEKSKCYVNLVLDKFNQPSCIEPRSQDAVFCPIYQQQASHNFNVYTTGGDFSNEFVGYLKEYDSLLFYGAAGMGCTTIFKKLCYSFINNKIYKDKSYVPIYIHANWLSSEIRINNYRIDKCIDIVLNDWINDPHNDYKVSDLCKKMPILIVLDDVNDEISDAVFKWICENINRKNVKIFLSTNSSRIRTKFEKTLSTALNGKMQFASIFLPLTNASQIGQNYKVIEPSLYELLNMTPYFKCMIDYCQEHCAKGDFEEISSVTSLITQYINDSYIAEEGKRCALEIFEGRQKTLEPNVAIIKRGLIHKEGRLYEFENKILYYYFLASKWYEYLLSNKDISSIESVMLIIKTKADYTSDAGLFHKYFISLSLDRLSQPKCLKDEEKLKVVNFYKEKLPLILAESLRWIRDGNELYWGIGLKGLLKIIKAPEKYAEIDVIDAERMLFQLGVGIEKKSDRPFLHYEEIPSGAHILKFLLPKDDFWFKLPNSAKIEIARFPVTVGEYSFFLDSGYFCARNDCNAQETFSEDDAKAAWDKIWGRDYDIDKVAGLMQKKWSLVHAKLNNNETIIKLCKLFSDKKQIKQLYLFKELFDKNNNIEINKSIEDSLAEIYSVDKLKYPMKWGDPIYNNPYYPIVGINYYEACAYCRWLSLMSQKKGKYEYRLLTKEEWQEMVRGVIPKREDIICNNDNQDDYLRIAFLTSLRNLNEDGKLNSEMNPTDAYGNIFELVQTRFSKIKYGDENMAHYYCFGGSYLQKYELAYDIHSKGPYEGQASSFQRNIDIGFRICRIKSE